MNIIVIDPETGKETPKSKWERFKEKAREKGQSAKAWCKDHTKELIVAVPVVVAGAKSIVKMVYRKTVVDKKEKLMKFSVYDRSENHYWFLKRELTNREWSEISNRRSKGERLGDILEKMKVLK